MTNKSNYNHLAPLLPTLTLSAMLFILQLAYTADLYCWPAADWIVCIYKHILPIMVARKIKLDLFGGRGNGELSGIDK